MLIPLIWLLAQVSIDTLPDLSDAELKHYFMACDRSSREGQLDDGDAATCSYIYESLKARVFKDDSRALLEWWREEKKKEARPDSSQQ